MAGIDRDYWLEFAKDGVSKSIESREKAADKLDTFLVWIWGIYTSVFALASLFNFLSGNICQLILVAQPILIVMLSRFFCAMVSMPSTNNDSNRADANDVASIIDSFQIIVNDKRKKLRRAIFFTVISIISISAALVSYNFFDPNKQLKDEIQTAKLKKDLHDQFIVPPKPQILVNDSIKSINDNLELQSQNIIQATKLKCIKNNDPKCLKTIKNFEK